MKKNCAFEKNKVTNVLGIILMIILISFFPTETLARKRGRTTSHGRFHSYSNSHSLILPFFLLHTSGNAEQSRVQKHIFYEDKEITSVIGSGVPNKFIVQNNKVSNIIGEGFTYEIEGDFFEDYILITPTKGIGERINLTFILDELVEI